MEYLKETDTYLVYRNGWTATVTGYDWVYIGLPGGHANGGTLSLLWHESVGPLITAGMSQYSLKEAGNMQLPRFNRHECLTPRLETQVDGKLYSSIYDRNCKLQDVSPENGSETILLAEGVLSSIDQQKVEMDGNYRLQYTFLQDGARISGECRAAGQWILPLISEQTEQVTIEENFVKIQKNEKIITILVNKGKMELPYGTERIYQLVPGMEALKIAILPENGEIDFCILF